MELLLFFAVVGIVIYLVHSKSQKRRQHATHNVAQRMVEARMIDILAAEPNTPDDVVALMVRDELVTAQIRDPEVFYWATPETSARLKRLAVRMVMDEQAAPRRLPAKKKRRKVDDDDE